MHEVCTVYVHSTAKRGGGLTHETVMFRDTDSRLACIKKIQFLVGNTVFCQFPEVSLVTWA